MLTGEVKCPSVPGLEFSCGALLHPRISRLANRTSTFNHNPSLLPSWTFEIQSFSSKDRFIHSVGTTNVECLVSVLDGHVFTPGQPSTWLPHLGQGPPHTEVWKNQLGTAQLTRVLTSLGWRRSENVNTATKPSTRLSIFYDTSEAIPKRSHFDATSADESMEGSM